MKRIALLALTAAIAVAAGMPVAGAAHNCDDGVSWSYCHEHVALSAFPLEFKYNNSGSPIDNTIARAAILDSIDEWNRHWPIPNRDKPLCPALCLAAGSGQRTAALNGENSIFWADSLSFPGCTTTHVNGVALACVWYGSGSNSHRILEVDIALQKNLDAGHSWYQPTLTSEAIRAVAGEAAGLYPEIGNNDLYDTVARGKKKHDFQSAVTHELGHAFGLEDIGETQPFPGRLSDAPRYQQTMYRYYYPGTTNKRTLGSGDIAGLLRIAAEVLIDGQE